MITFYKKIKRMVEWFEKNEQKYTLPELKEVILIDKNGNASLCFVATIKGRITIPDFTIGEVNENEVPVGAKNKTYFLDIVGDKCFLYKEV